MLPEIVGITDIAEIDGSEWGFTSGDLKFIRDCGSGWPRLQRLLAMNAGVVGSPKIFEVSVRDCDGGCRPRLPADLAEY